MGRASGQLERSLAALTIGVQQSIKLREGSSVSEAANETYQQVQVPLSGEAATDIAFVDAAVTWRLPFLLAPQQRQVPFVTPHFAYGVEFTGDAPTEPVLIHASVLSWTTDARNWLVGATIRFTCQAPSVPVEETVPYTALAHLTFQGYAAQSEDNGIIIEPPITPTTVSGSRSFSDYFTSDDLASYTSVAGAASIDLSRSPWDGRLVIGSGGAVLTPDVFWEGGTLTLEATASVSVSDPGAITIVAPGVFTVSYQWVPADSEWAVSINGVVVGHTGGTITLDGLHVGVAIELDWDNITATLFANGREAAVSPAYGGNQPVLSLLEGDYRSITVSTPGPVTATGRWRDNFVRVEGGGSTPSYVTAWSNSLFGGGGGTDGVLTSQPMPAGTGEELDIAEPGTVGPSFSSVVGGMLLDSAAPLNAHGQVKLWQTVRTVNDLSGNGFALTAMLFLGSNVYVSTTGELLGADGLTIDPSATLLASSYVLGLTVLDDSTGDTTNVHLLLSGVPHLPCWLALRGDAGVWAAELWSVQNPFSGDVPQKAVTMPPADVRQFSADAIGSVPAMGYRNLDTDVGEIGPVIELGQVRWEFKPPGLIP